MQHRIPGLPPTDLLSYLVGLGLGRAISRQVPGHTTWAWDKNSDALLIETEVEDIARFLVDDYRPVPILSPWNNGSGFAPQDKNQRATLTKLLDSGARLADWRTADEVGRRVVAQEHSLNPSKDWTKDRKAKERAIRQLRNQWPDSALEWLDAAIVLTTEGAQFPPLLGSGGNDGRLDFSANFHTNLLAVLPDAGAAHKQSISWASALLQGTHAGKLDSRSVGQFDASAAGTPRSGTFGTGRSLINPWAFVLMVEGALLFAAAPARRLGEAPGRASMPFTVFGSPDGPTPASPAEDFRGELWVPVWSHLSRLNEVEQVFAEARATWDGSTAVRSAQMYGAVRSFGADRRIDRFIRYGLAKRNGLAYMAIPLDDVRVTAAPNIEAAIPLTHRARPLRPLHSNALDVLQRVFDRRLMDYLRRTSPDDLLQSLAALTRWELAVIRSRAAREKGLHLPARAKADEVRRILQDRLDDSPELRVAASLASGTTRTATGLVSTRQILLGNIPDPADREWREPAVRGLGARPLVDVLCDAAVWCEQHSVVKSTRPDSDKPKEAVDQPNSPHQKDTVGGRSASASDADDAAGVTSGTATRERGIRMASRHGFRLQKEDFPLIWRDVHAWAGGDLDDHYLEMAFLAFLALDWRRPRDHQPQLSHRDLTRAPLPELAILEALNSADVRLPDDSAAEPRIQGLQQGWLLRLRADRTTEVMAEATALLNRSHLLGRSTTARTTDQGAHAGSVASPIPTVRGPRLVAALMTTSTSIPLRMLTVPRDVQDFHDTTTDSSSATQGDNDE